MIVFSPDNRKAVHPPDVCLEGAGLGIIEKREQNLSVPLSQDDTREMVMRELITAGRSGNAVNLFIYKCGDSYTPSFFVQQAVIIWNGVLNRNASGALIRFTVPVVNGRTEEAQAFALKLAKQMLPEINEKLP